MKTSIDRRNFLKSSLLGAAAIGLQGCASLSARSSITNRKPNIILILIDDLGYSDLGCYGNRFMDTPNIDRLASQGMTFSSAYTSAPICSASRAALLTGRSPARLGYEFVTREENDRFDWNDEWMEKWKDKKIVPPPYTVNLPLEEITIAERLKTAGYITGMTGKWHVAGHHDHYLGWNPTFGPKQQGFDWGTENFGSHPYSKPKKKRRAFDLSIQEGQFPCDELTEAAIGFLQEKREQPFFLFVSHYYVHVPLGTPCKWLHEKYKARGEKQGYTEDRIQYGAFMETMDHYIGQLMNALEQSGQAENTVVLFTSDNGGHPEFAFNAPLRGSKWNLYEGGVRVPMMVRWPGKIRPNSQCDTPVISTDFLPTFCDIADTRCDDRALDGISLLPLLRNRDKNRKQFDTRNICWHFPNYHPERKYDQCPTEIGIEDGYIGKTTPQSTIREGDYKLIYFYETQEIELYRLSNDIGEQNDLSTSMPEKARDLQDKLFSYLKSVNARFPRKKPHFKSLPQE